MINKLSYATATIKRIAYTTGLIFLSLIIGLLSEPVVRAQSLDTLRDNNIVWFDNRCIPYNSDERRVILSGKDNLEKILNFYMSKGMSLFQAAAIAGNYEQESKFDPEALNSIGAFGIAQWLGGRKDNLMKKSSPESLETQLEFSWEELQGPEKAAYDAFMAYTGSDIGDLAVVFGEKYERYGTNEEGSRRQYAKTIYDTYMDAPPVGGSNSRDSGETAIYNMPTNERMPTIALDPGHSTNAINEIDDETGVLMADYSNGQEDKDVFEVAQRTKTLLEEEGYNVVIVKNFLDETVNYRDRIGRAEQAGAAMGISIHTDVGVNEIYNQFVGGYRFDQHGDITNRHEFTNSETAARSAAYSASIAEGRSKIEGHDVSVTKNNFTGRDGIWGGDLPVISLLSDSVPWVYSEFSGAGSNGGSNGISEEEIQLYAEGLVEGIKNTDLEAIPGGVDSCGNPNGSGRAGSGFEATLLGYAWPSPISNGDTNATDTYKSEVIATAKDRNRYIGGISHPGIDCGGFVTNLLIDSGFETNYNYGGDISKGAGPTGTQETWLKENWNHLNPGGGIMDAADLPQGAVAIQPGHTFVYVGEVEGFDSDVASASMDDRAPAAGGNSITESGINWYAKKGS